eukprot:Pgem_evm1s19966
MLNIGILNLMPAIVRERTFREFQNLVGTQLTSKSQKHQEVELIPLRFDGYMPK